MSRKPRWTAKRSYEAVKAELSAKRREAASILRDLWQRRQALPGYLSRDTREEVETLIADLEAS